MSSIASTTPASTSAAHAMPALWREQRDEDGRRVSVSFESQRVAPTQPAADGWLVALDGSSHSMHALTTAIGLASDSGTRMIDLVNVQPWLSKEAADAELARRGWAVGADACALLDATRLGWRLHVLMGEPAARIVEQAQALGSRVIVIGARGLTATESLLLGSVAQQVIHTAQGAVLVVRASANSPEKPPC